MPSATRIARLELNSGSLFEISPGVVIQDGKLAFESLKRLSLTRILIERLVEVLKVRIWVRWISQHVFEFEDSRQRIPQGRLLPRCLPAKTCEHPGEGPTENERRERDAERNTSCFD